MPTIRRATVADRPFLEEMLAVAIDWRPGVDVRPVADVMAMPALAHYVAGWGADTDVGFVAVDDAPVGAAWWRFLPEHDAGHGFVDETTPELAIGVIARTRGRGVGTLLLNALIDEARRRSIPGLSLSVEPANPAATLYRSMGFETVGSKGGSLIMGLGLTYP